MKEMLRFATRVDFRSWLEEHCLSSEGVWIVFDKANKNETLSANDALEEALCFGWIDGQMKRIDDFTYQKYFAMRRAHSKWSEKNKALSLKLEEQGLMTAYGKEKIQEAKAQGEWEKNHTILLKEDDLQDLTAALFGIEPAYTNFLAMSPSVKRTYTKAYMDPKTEAGKQKRFEWIVDRLHKNLKPM